MKAIVKITSHANPKELRVGDYMDFWIVPAYSKAEILVEDENGNTLYERDDFTIEQGKGLLSYSDALEDPDDEDNQETLNWFTGAKFETVECFKKAWEEFLDKNLDEIEFCFQLIRAAVGKEDGEIEVELSTSGNRHQPLVVTYEIDLYDDEFDSSKIDFIGFDLGDDDLAYEIGCAGIISRGFGGEDCVLMNIMRYGDTFYQTCGDDDGFINGCEIIDTATVDCGKVEMSEI